MDFEQLGATHIDFPFVPPAIRYGPRGIARAAARWTRDIASAKFEGTTGPRAACDNAKAEMKEAAN